MSDLLGSFLEVQWDDIVTWGAWIEKDSTEGWTPPHLCTSYGFLVHDAHDFIVLSGSKGADDYNQHVSIPKGVVKSMREVQLPPKEE